ncbi:MAG: YihY/virulence factor BrkB family protein [Clostridiales bacterium]|nr:YihY/virulence factor BrkB family protein [Clostridiales bacterium]
MKKLFHSIQAVSQRFSRDNISMYSAQAAFFIVVSLIPLIMVLISLIQFFFPDGQETLMQTVSFLLPTTLGDFAVRTINELFHTEAYSVISISTILSLWAASKGVMGMEQGMHRIYHTTPKGNYLVRRLRCTLYTLVLLIAILVACALLVFGRSINSLLEENVSFLSQMTQVLFAFRVLISIICFVLVFTLGYKILTGGQCTFLEALPGVVCATIGWMIFSACYSVYITRFSSYTYLYGSLGALILLLLWLYCCILILMVGAELNIFLTELRRKKHRED